ncbi:hypothetical protein EMIT0324P_11585 [Pseudomonas chlororaphis]
MKTIRKSTTRQRVGANTGAPLPRTTGRTTGPFGPHQAQKKWFRPAEKAAHSLSIGKPHDPFVTLNGTGVLQVNINL